MELVFDLAFFRRWLTEAAAAVEREATHLTQLDSAIGDADHGINMQRGFRAATAAMDQNPPLTPGAMLVAVGRTLIGSVGGAAGPLYGTALRRAGKELGDQDVVTAEQLREALHAGIGGVSDLGGAAVGDKTMLDALIPAVEALGAALDARADPLEALTAAAAAAQQGAVATIPLLARKGRASYLGERSIGHQDPGATSSALLVAALVTAAGPGGADPA